MRCAALLLVLWPAVASADPPWVGTWSAEPEWCRNAEHVGSRTPAPVRLTPDEFLGYENSCAITQVRQVGSLDAWRMRLECQSEGSVHDEDVLVLTEGDDVLWWFQGIFEPVRFARCG